MKEQRKNEQFLLFSVGEETCSFLVMVSHAHKLG